MPLVPDAVKRLSIRSAVLAGFALIFGLWVVLGLDLVSRAADVERRTADVHARFTRAEELLSEVRTQILLGSIYRRDALLDTPDRAGYYRDQLEELRGSVDRLLAKYVPVTVGVRDRETLAQLKTELEDFWTIVVPAASSDSALRAEQARTLLRDRAIPKRVVILSISERIQDLNRAAFLEQQAQLSGIYRVMRRQVWEMSAGVLLLGLVVALLVIGYTGRLEGRIQEQGARERENARNLQRLSAQLVRAQEEERRSIARELHDEIGQALTAIKVQMAFVERALEPEASKREMVREARSITDRALQTVRDLSQLLHPSLLDDLGLAATLDWYLTNFSKRTTIATQLLRDGTDERLAPEIETCLYRVVQEALTNVARHANATTCHVYLQRLAHTVLLTVEDNGRGFDVQAVKERQDSRGLGLLGVQERATGFGGQFRIESTAGKGTRLTVELPALAPDTSAAPLPDAEAEPGAASAASM